MTPGRIFPGLRHRWAELSWNFEIVEELRLCKVGFNGFNIDFFT
jgi:hypothetical protein